MASVANIRSCFTKSNLDITAASGWLQRFVRWLWATWKNAGTRRQRRTQSEWPKCTSCEKPKKEPPQSVKCLRWPEIVAWRKAESQQDEDIRNDNDEREKHRDNLQNGEDAVRPAKWKLHRGHAYHLTRMSSGTAGESEHGLQWGYFHNLGRRYEGASGWLERLVRLFFFRRLIGARS